MKIEGLEGKKLDQYLGCYGRFAAENPICQKCCSLSLRCAIEKDHHSRMELLEDLISSDGYVLKMQ
ncbi:MAG: hypothetical protein PVJ53_08585 [Desulfobacterales bacterium]|jgi:hypothetical protein